MGFAWSNFPCSLQTPQNMVQCSWYLPYIHDHHLRLTIIESTHFCEAPHIIEAESKIKAALVTGYSPCSLYCCIFPSLALKYWPGHDGEEDGEALTCSCKFLMHCTSISFNGFTNTCSMSSPSHSRCTTWQHLSMNSLHWQRQHHQQQRTTRTTDFSLNRSTWQPQVWWSLLLVPLPALRWHPWGIPKANLTSLFQPKPIEKNPRSYSSREFPSVCLSHAWHTSLELNTKGATPAVTIASSPMNAAAPPELGLRFTGMHLWIASF